MKEKTHYYFKAIWVMMLTCIFALQVTAQQTSAISGTVVDNTGEPVIGASILVKGTSNGSITDLDGRFNLTNVSPNGTIIVSYIGYITQEIAVKGQKNFAVKLIEDSKTLDEVVVVGYGVQRKSDLTGAVASVKMGDALKASPSGSVSDALQGRLAGVSIVSGSGAPGNNATIRVRGVNSISADEGPLVVIDGFIGGGLNSLNPSDIQSIEVLKDASATAVYGSRGANGVILVTTKSPEKGKVKVEYNGYASFKTPSNLPSLLSPGEFADLANDWSADNKKKPAYTVEQVTDLKNGIGGYDYMGNIFRDVSIEHNHELSISGGNEKTKFIMSASYNGNQGTVNQSSSDQMNYRLKVDTDILKWLKAGVNIWGTYNKSKGPRFSQYEGILLEALSFDPAITPQNEDGTYNHQTLDVKRYNPMGHINELNTGGYAHKTWIQGYVDVALLKGLTFRMLQGFTFNNKNAYGTNNEKSYDYYKNSVTSATATSNHEYSWLNSNILSYVKEFNKNHRINATAVFEQQYGNNFMNKTIGTGLYSTVIGANNTGLAKKTDASTNRVITTMMSAMARVNYVLMNRYMLTASLRYDGSSRLAYNNRWEAFPSMALAWNVKEEAFMQQVSAIDQFKVRFGYGETGNQAVPAYSAFTQYKAGVRDGNGNLSFTTELGNPNLKWERTCQYNGGIDLGFLNNRLTLSLDVYHKLSKDVILSIQTPTYTGFASQLGNSANILNKGFEITLGGDPFIGKNFSWNTNITLSKNVGTFEKLADGMDYMQLGDNKYEQLYYRNILGEKISTMYGYVCEGVWTTEEIADPSIKKYAKARAGAYKYVDQNGDGKINDSDKKVIGNGQPTFNWGWSNTLNYKNLDLNIFIMGVHGFDVYNYTRQARVNCLSPTPELLNRWKAGTNEHASIASFGADRDVAAKDVVSSLFVEKGDFVKVKSITLGYTLPATIINKMQMNSLRIYASIQNPFMITGYSGIDPEVTLNNPLTSGIDWGYYPNGRNFLIGLNFSF